MCIRASPGGCPRPRSRIGRVPAKLEHGISRLFGQSPAQHYFCAQRALPRRAAVAAFSLPNRQRLAIIPPQLQLTISNRSSKRGYSYGLSTWGTCGDERAHHDAKTMGGSCFRVELRAARRMRDALSALAAVVGCSAVHLRPRTLFLFGGTG